MARAERSFRILTRLTLESNNFLKNFAHLDSPSPCQDIIHRCVSTHTNSDRRYSLADITRPPRTNTTKKAYTAFSDVSTHEQATLGDRIASGGRVRQGGGVMAWIMRSDRSAPTAVGRERDRTGGVAEGSYQSQCEKSGTKGSVICG